MKALIGFTGFVGGNIAEQAKFDEFYNSSNIDEIKGKSFDLVVSCGTPSLRWLANKEPEQDLKVIQKLIDALKHVKSKKFVLISTIDAYDNPIDVDEDSDIDESKQNSYGKHRYMLENFVRENFDHHIIRLPNLFGNGLKKNIVYDFLNNNETYKIDSEGIYQWYNLDNIWKDIKKVIDNDIKTINFATEPCTVKELVKEAFRIDFDNTPTNNHPRYDFQTKYAKLWNKKGKYLYTKDEVLFDLKKFVEEIQNLRLGVSTVAWRINEEDAVKKLLHKEGIKGVEITPDRLYDENFEFDEKKINDYKKYWHGTEIISIQGVLFKKDHLKLFDTYNNRNALAEQLKKVINVASEMNIPVVMFGSPKNRKKGTLTKEEADAIAIPFFKEIARYAYSKDVCFCMEPNPKEYDSDYLLNTKEVIDFVKKVNHPGIGINLDTGALNMSGENASIIIKAGNLIKHFHISEPMLASVKNIEEETHKLYRNALKKICYNNWISIEMKKVEENNLENIKESIEKIRKTYKK